MAANAGREGIALPLIGGLLLVAGIAAAALLPAGTLAGWLAALVLVHAVGLAGLILLLMMRLIPGAWGPQLQTACEAVLPLLAIAAIGSIPILVGMASFYPWVTQPVSPGFKAFWLTPAFFSIRTVAWFLLANGIGWRAWQRRITTPLACAGLIFLVLGASLVLTDWLMTLDADFHSSGFGLQLLAVGMSAGYAAILLARLNVGPRPDASLLGALFLTLQLIWAYFQFLPFFIIWSGNLAGGADWYAPRITGAWSAALVAWALLGGGPLLALLLPPVRASVRALRILAVLVLAGKAIEFCWFAMPGRTGWAVLDFVAAFAGFGLIAIFALHRAWRVQS